MRSKEWGMGFLMYYLSACIRREPLLNLLRSNWDWVTEVDVARAPEIQFANWRERNTGVQIDTLRLVPWECASQAHIQLIRAVQLACLPHAAIHKENPLTALESMIPEVPSRILAIMCCRWRLTLICLNMIQWPKSEERNVRLKKTISQYLTTWDVP